MVSRATNQEIRDRLARYIAGELSLKAFEDWLIPATWEIHKFGDQDLVALAGAVKRRLAEFSSGHWTEEELKRQLMPMVTRYKLDLVSAPHTASSSELKEIRIVYPGVAVDIQPVKVSV